MKGDCVKPKINLVNLIISIIFESRLSTQRKRNKSLPHSRMGICRKAFSISPHSNIGLNLDLVRISQTKFYNRGPVSRHSFNDTFFVVCVVFSYYYSFVLILLLRAAYNIRYFIIEIFHLLSVLFRYLADL